MRELCAVPGITVLSINALYPFDVWNDERRAQAIKLATYARECGAQGLVMCPLNEPGDTRNDAQRAAGLRTALSELAPILREYGILGFVEPLGFEESALRRSVWRWTQSSPLAAWMCSAWCTTPSTTTWPMNMSSSRS